MTMYGEGAVRVFAEKVRLVRWEDGECLGAPYYVEEVLVVVAACATRRDRAPRLGQPQLLTKLACLSAVVVCYSPMHTTPAARPPYPNIDSLWLRANGLARPAYVAAAFCVKQVGEERAEVACAC